MSKERHQLPAAIVEGFELVRLTPFSTGDVMALVRQRLASVGVMDSDFTMQDATAILDECDGYPASVITILRDAVDSIRMAQSNDGPALHLDTSARIQRDEPETLRRLMGERTDEAVPNGEFEQETPAQGLIEPTEEPEKASSEVIDASTPWHERPAFPTSPNATGQEEQQAPPTGFELDMNRLFEAQEQDEPLQPAPFNTPIIDADEVLGGVSASVTGMFKGWRSATRMQALPRARRPMKASTPSTSWSEPPANSSTGWTRRCSRHRLPLTCPRKNPP